jgi:chitin synthase
MGTLGFKERHKEGVWRLIAALLTLGNVEFEDALSKRDVQAGYMGGANGLGGNVVEGQEEVRIQNPGMMDRAARLLGVTADDLRGVLTVKSGYFKKEVVSRYLDVHEARKQQDALIGGLYTLLFSYIVETANHKLNPIPSSTDPTAQIETSQVILVDLPGFTTRASMGNGTLVSAASGGNGFTEFCTNFQDELIHSHILRAEFDQSHSSLTNLTNDGVQLPSMTIMDNANVVELLRGGLVDGDRRSVMGKKVGGLLGVMGKAAQGLRKGSAIEDSEMVQEMTAGFGANHSFIQPVHDPFASTASFNSPPAPGRRFTNFGIQHYAGPVTYNVTDWVESDCDGWDAGFLRILRGGSEGFVKR